MKVADYIIKYLADYGINDIIKLLTNNNHSDYPICRRFKYRKSSKERIGTIATLVINLKEKSMFISRGSPLKYPFEKIFVDNNNVYNNKNNSKL